MMDSKSFLIYMFALALSDNTTEYITLSKEITFSTMIGHSGPLPANRRLFVLYLIKVLSQSQPGLINCIKCSAIIKILLCLYVISKRGLSGHKARGKCISVSRAFSFDMSNKLMAVCMYMWHQLGFTENFE